MSKSERYLYDWEAMKEPTADSQGERSRRTVWSINTTPYAGAHFAVFPPELARLCILAGSQPGSVVLDPFLGSGTTGMVALQHGRGFVGIELKEEYAALARERISSVDSAAVTWMTQECASVSR
jgi:DNA modification methylase